MPTTANQQAQGDHKSKAMTLFIASAVHHEHVSERLCQAGLTLKALPGILKLLGAIAQCRAGQIISHRPDGDGWKLVKFSSLMDRCYVSESGIRKQLRRAEQIGLIELGPRRGSQAGIWVRWDSLATVAAPLVKPTKTTTSPAQSPDKVLINLRQRLGFLPL